MNIPLTIKGKLLIILNIRSLIFENNLLSLNQFSAFVMNNEHVIKGRVKVIIKKIKSVFKSKFTHNILM